MHARTRAHTHTYIYNNFIAIVYPKIVCTMFTYSLILITDMLFLQLAITAFIDPGSLNNKTLITYGAQVVIIFISKDERFFTKLAKKD